MAHIQVLIVEDDPIWMKGIADYLEREPDITVKALASNKEEAVEICKSAFFDIVLMDINLSENKLDGIDAALEINEIAETKIIMLTSFNEEEIILNSFAAGAVNYISKSDYRNLPSAIRSACNSTFHIKVLINDYLRLKKEEKLSVLTNAEREVFELIEQGYTQSHIEKKLHKSESTVKNQVNQILKKLRVRNSKEAIEKVRSRLQI